MSDTDLLIDRKRLKARLATWRLLALITIVGAAAFYTSGIDQKTSVGVTDYVAQITLEGVMEDNPERDALLEKILNDHRAKALIVRLDSPGGTTIAGEEVYLQLRKIAEKKPVVGVMRTLCTSACYMAALGTDQIFAREGTVTGSIGVMMQGVELSELAKKLGVHPISIKSGPYKDVPSISEPFTEEQRAVVATLVDDAYQHFVRLITQRRALDETKARSLADGRVYTGNQAASLQLIDQLGSTEEARAWLAKEKKISQKLDLRELDSTPEIPAWADMLRQAAGIKIWGNHTLGLDGLTSIWHPALQ